MKKIVLSFLWIGLLSFSFISCEKKDPTNPESPDADSEEWTIMDETYVHFAFLSLWADEAQIARPKNYTEVRNFTKNYKNADDVLRALMERTPLEGPGGTPVDRYSFIDKEGQVEEEIGEGIHRNIGLSAQFMYRPGTSTVGLFIRLIHKNSPSETAGLTRGMEVLAVDGKTLSFSLDSRGNVTGTIAEANKLLSGDVSTVSVRSWNRNGNQIVSGEATTATIPSVGQWSVDPIVVSNILEVDQTNKKIGYMAYSSFVSVFDQVKNDKGEVVGVIENNYHHALTNLFSAFESEGIDELIVDFRYNGGGATNAAELLTNLIVPMGNNGQVMYQYTTNDYLKSDGEVPPVLVNKANSLNLDKVYFLVTRSSASASEMVINSLKPYMDVQIISTGGQGTYGKPVGSFGEEIIDDAGEVLATTYITSIKIVNKEGYGDYYAGIPGNKQDSGDDVFNLLGNPQETLLYDAIYHIRNGSYRVTPPQQARIMRGNRSSVTEPEPIGTYMDHSVQGLYHLEHRPAIKLNK